MSKQSPRTAGRDSRTQPEAYVPGIEAVAFKAVEFLAQKYGPPLAAAVYHALKGEQKIFVQIDASWRVANNCFVALSLRNLTGHGLYVENISLDEPKNQQLDVVPGYPKYATMDFGDGTIEGIVVNGLPPPKPPVLPILLKVGVEPGTRVYLPIAPRRFKIRERHHRDRVYSTGPT